MTNKTYMLQSMSIHGIKTIENLNIKFPMVGNTAVKMTGGNYHGKTTILQCLNTACANDISKPLSAENIQYGKIVAGVTVKLISNIDSGVYTINVTIKPSGIEYTLQTPTGAILKGKNAIKKLLNYHYISANKIMELVASKPGRTKLMEYFLYSVSEDVKNQYLKLDKEEGILYKKRTTLNVEQMKLKAVAEKQELTANETVALSTIDVEVAKWDELEKVTQEWLGKIAIYDNDKKTYDTNLTSYQIALNRANDNIKSHQEDIARYSEQLAEEQTKHNTVEEQLQTLLASTLTSINNINTDFGLSALSFRNYATQYIDAYDTLLNSINSDEITTLKDIIKEGDKLLSNSVDKLNNTTKSIGDLIKPNLTDIATYEAELEEAREDEKTQSTILMTLTNIQNQYKNYKERLDEYTTVHEEWLEKDTRIKDIREEKEILIAKEDIDIPGFKFSVDGVMLDTRNISEQTISGAERRTIAAQFTMGMNKNVRFVILEEMESFDPIEEQKICKFMLDKGYLPISDFVTHGALEVETIIIE